jgi:hypothetical protein
MPGLFDEFVAENLLEDASSSTAFFCTISTEEFFFDRPLRKNARSFDFLNDSFD